MLVRNNQLHTTTDLSLLICPIWTNLNTSVLPNWLVGLQISVKGREVIMWWEYWWCESLDQMYVCVCVHVNPQTETHPHKSLFEYIYLKADWALKPSCRDYLVQVMFGIWEETVKQEQFSRSHTWSSKTSQVQVLTHLPSGALTTTNLKQTVLLYCCLCTKKTLLY